MNEREDQGKRPTVVILAARPRILLATLVATLLLTLGSVSVLASRGTLAATWRVGAAPRGGCQLPR